MEPSCSIVTTERQLTAVVKAQVPFAWCRAEKLDLAGVNWEIYSPWKDVEPAKLETHLYAKLT